MYFFVLVFLWLISPKLAYNFSELIEAHAVDTYTEFFESNKDALILIPAPKSAIEYYMSKDMYVFDEFQTDIARGSRRPIVNTMYDVFLNIAQDEQAHVSTMNSCQGISQNDRQMEAVQAAVTDVLLVAFVIGFSILSSGGLVQIDVSVIETTSDFVGKSLSQFFSNEEMSDSSEVFLSPLFDKIIDALSKIRLP